MGGKVAASSALRVSPGRQDEDNRHEFVGLPGRAGGGGSFVGGLGFRVYEVKGLGGLGSFFWGFGASGIRSVRAVLGCMGEAGCSPVNLLGSCVFFLLGRGWGVG